MKLLGEELGSKVKPLWGLSPEGELQGLWRDCGVPNLYVVLGNIHALLSLWCTVTELVSISGNLALCRFHSSHIALRECSTPGLVNSGFFSYLYHIYAEIKAKEVGLFTSAYKEDY